MACIRYAHLIRVQVKILKRSHFFYYLCILHALAKLEELRPTMGAARSFELAYIPE
jgi:hypothetical protein